MPASETQGKIVGRNESWDERRNDGGGETWVSEEGLMLTQPSLASCGPLFLGKYLLLAFSLLLLSS